MRLDDFGTAVGTLLARPNTSPTVENLSESDFSAPAAVKSCIGAIHLTQYLTPDTWKYDLAAAVCTVAWLPALYQADLAEVCHFCLESAWQNKISGSWRTCDTHTHTHVLCTSRLTGHSVTE